MARLPTPGGDANNWGTVLNDFLAQAHNADGTLKADSVNSTALADSTVSNSTVTASADIDQSKIHNLTSDLATKAPLTSPTFTGTVTVPVPSNGTDAATKTYVDSALSSATPTALYRYKGRSFSTPKPNNRAKQWAGDPNSWSVPSAAQSITKASTTLPLGGDTSYEIVTKGDGANILGTHSARTTFNYTANPNYQLAIYVWVDDPTKLSSLVFYVSSSSGNSYIYNVITSAPSADKPTLPTSRWQKITLAVGAQASTQGAPVNTALNRVIISVNDNNQVATVRLSNRMEWEPAAKAAWPNGVVTICFDDGYKSAIDLGMPILGGYGYPAVFVPITGLVGSDNNTYYTWDDLRRMQDELGCQVASHCRYNTTPIAQHNGFTTLTAQQMVDAVCESREDIEAQGLWGSEDFAYPNGAYGAGVETGMVYDYIRQYIRSARASSTNRRVETLPAWNPYQLGAASDVGGPSVPINVYTNTSTGLLNRVQASGGWATVTFHSIIASGTATTNQCTVADLQAFVDRINTLGIAVATTSEVLESLR